MLHQLDILNIIKNIKYRYEKFWPHTKQLIIYIKQYLQFDSKLLIIKKELD